MAGATGKASIIVPAKNVGAFISECLDSLRSQTYADFEVLVIDDGSTDDTFAIAAECSNQDTRVSVFSNSGHGVSSARNYGIEHSNGDYLLFVDADDIVDSRFVEDLVGLISRFNVDCAAVGITSFVKDMSSQRTAGETVILSEQRRYEGIFGACGGYLANKIYLSRIIKEHGLRLDEHFAMAEDLLFNLNYLQKCGDFAYNPNVRYFYRKHTESAANNLANPRWFEILDVYEEARARIDMDVSLRSRFDYAYSLVLCEAYYRSSLLESVDRKNVRGRIVEAKKQRGSLARLGFSERIKFLLFRLFPGFVMKYRYRRMG